MDGSNGLTSLSIKASTADPALTNNMTRLGFFNSDTIFSRDVAPITFVPLASFFIKSSTLDTVLLKATTYNTKTTIITEYAVSTTTCILRFHTTSLIVHSWSHSDTLHSWPVGQLAEKSSYSWIVHLESDWLRCTLSQRGCKLFALYYILLDQKIILHCFDTLFGQ